MAEPEAQPGKRSALPTGTSSPPKRQRTDDLRSGFDSDPSYLCPNGCPRGSCPVRWKPIPYLEDCPSPDAFQKTFGKRRIPFIVSAGCAARWGWLASKRGRWRDLRYFEEHHQVQAMERLFDRPQGFRPIALRVAPSSKDSSQAAGTSIPVTPAEAFRKLRLRRQLGGYDGVALYMGAWEYDADDWDAPEGGGFMQLGLTSELKPGPPFASCLLESLFGENHPLLRCLRWIYVGEPSSGTSPHFDPIATHGWMWLAAGRKAWRFVSGAPGSEGLTAAPKGTPPDLFCSAGCSSLASLASSGEGLQMWEGNLEEGEVIFIPAGLLHTVKNLPSTTSIAVSHNWLDWTNLADVLNFALPGLKHVQAKLDDEGSTSFEEALQSLEALAGPQGRELCMALLGSSSSTSPLPRPAAKLAELAAQQRRRLGPFAKPDEAAPSPPTTPTCEASPDDGEADRRCHSQGSRKEVGEIDEEHDDDDDEDDEDFGPQPAPADVAASAGPEEDDDGDGDADEARTSATLSALLDSLKQVCDAIHHSHTFRSFAEKSTNSEREQGEDEQRPAAMKQWREGYVEHEASNQAQPAD